MRIDACKSSTRKLSHVSKFEPKFALVADFLVFEDRHFTGKTSINPFGQSTLLFVSRLVSSGKTVPMGKTVPG